MKKNFLFFIAALAILFNINQVYAEKFNNLTLTPKEIQKLQKFFPNESDSSKLTWNGNPLEILLPLNQEKRLIFPSRISADLKGAVTTTDLSVINVNKSLYLKAKNNFNKTRMFVTLADSKEVILIDLVPTNKITDLKQEIVTPNNKILSNHKDVNNDPLSPSKLLRLAWRLLFSEDLSSLDTRNLTRVALNSNRFEPGLIYGDKVLAHPMISWKSDSLYVTAIYLRNKYQKPELINLKTDLCGAWKLASLYPFTKLEGNGNKNKDSTTLMLISTKPFHEAIGICYGNA